MTGASPTALLSVSPAHSATHPASLSTPEPPNATPPGQDKDKDKDKDKDQKEKDKGKGKNP